HTENAIARLERGDIAANRFDIAGDIEAEDHPPWPAKAIEEAHEDGVRTKLAAIGAVDGCCAHADQNIVRAGFGLCDVADAIDVRRSVARDDGRFHVMAAGSRGDASEVAPEPWQAPHPKRRSRHAASRTRRASWFRRARRCGRW